MKKSEHKIRINQRTTSEIGKKSVEEKNQFTYHGKKVSTDENKNKIWLQQQ